MAKWFVLFLLGLCTRPGFCRALCFFHSVHSVQVLDTFVQVLYNVCMAYVFTDEDRRKGRESLNRRNERRKTLRRKANEEVPAMIKLGDTDVGERVLGRVALIALECKNPATALRAANVLLPYLFPRYSPVASLDDTDTPINIAKAYDAAIKKSYPDLDLTQPYKPSENGDVKNKEAG